MERKVGRVCAYFPEKGYGFVTQEDSCDLWFHVKEVMGRAKSKVKLNALMEYSIKQGEKGLYASECDIIDDEANFNT